MARTPVSRRTRRPVSLNEIASLLVALAAVITAVASLLAVFHA